MIIKSLELANFRKFRDPLRIDGFTDGLNIVVEPNETGKSTLLEALRAAFFIRHSAKTELVRSYVPLGDDVAPRVAVEFTLRGQAWSVEKQFMKATSVRLTGNGSRRESDAAEEALQELLGFERGNNRGTDPETRGPLGMLWVEQMSALRVDSPNRIVRDSVRGVLEAEVGAVTGGRRFDAIRSKVEVAYGALRTTSTGKSRGELAAAESRLVSAAKARQRAETAFREYEQALTDLENARARLRIVERDLADPGAVEERRRLEGDQKLAETASLRLATAEAQHGRADELAKAASAQVERLAGAENRAAEAAALVGTAQVASDKAQATVDAAASEEGRKRLDLEEARAELRTREKAFGDARERVRRFTVAAGARRAIDARQALGELEARERTLREEAALALADGELDELARLEREELAALARFEAGSVRVELELEAGAELRIDDEPSDATSVDVLVPTRFQIGDSGSIVVRPPQGSGRSIEADMAAARKAVAAKLAKLNLKSYADGVARGERAASAKRELVSLRAQIAAACPGDPTIGLAPGADALRAFVAEMGANADGVAPPDDDIEALEAAVTDARLAEAAAAATHDECRTALSKSESVLAGATADLSAAARQNEAASANLLAILDGGKRASLEATAAELQRERAAATELLDQARAGAKAFDLDAIRRRLDNMDRAAARAGQERLDLTGRIASLQATVQREGKSGPAGQLAEAREEELAATALRDRLRLEADTLEHLRKALAEAADDASRTLLAPVTRRAARYVDRLLPGCGLTFDEGLGLTAVSRAGMNEGCADLSRGTQEQLAILTRLAFADLLLEDGAPLSLILDDPLVYSDDARLETMTEILQEAAQRMQVILLTCRTKAFRHVDGNRITLA